jgi:hypothetical protein
MKLCTCVANGGDAVMRPVGPVELDAWVCEGCGATEVEVEATGMLMQRQWIEPHWKGDEETIIQEVAQKMGVPVRLRK